MEGLQRGATHDTFVCAAGYLIGEYGGRLEEVAAMEQFRLLQNCFLTSSVETKVSSYGMNAPVVIQGD